jgi:uncharacterized RDD family membrane protein YckC
MNAEQLARNETFLTIVRRVVATWIDMIVMFGLLLAADWALGNESYQRVFPIIFPVALFHPMLLEYLCGCTVGKAFMDLRVVQIEKTTPGPKTLLIRHLVRIFEVYLFGLIGLIAVATHPSQQRLGDRWTGVYVLPRKRLAQTQTPPPLPSTA